MDVPLLDLTELDQAVWQNLEGGPGVEVNCQSPEEATSCQLVLTFQSSCWICRTRRPSSV